MTETDSCLVLCIEERDNDDYDNVETTLFVTYDFESETYVLYGKRHDQPSKSEGTFTTKFEPFFFRMDEVDEVYEFVKIIISKRSKCSYTLYNYNNMPVDCDTVDYDFMKCNAHINYELVAYDYNKIKRGELSRLLTMLYSVYNFY